MPTAATTTAVATPSQIVWPATIAAASELPAPIRRATSAVTAMLSPTATAYSKVSTASVSPTAATALGPRPATKKISTTANTDSIAISSIIGIASSRTARPMLPLV